MAISIGKGWRVEAISDTRMMLLHLATDSDQARQPDDRSRQDSLPAAGGVSVRHA